MRGRDGAYLSCAASAAYVTSARLCESTLRNRSFRHELQHARSVTHIIHAHTQTNLNQNNIKPDEILALCKLVTNMTDARFCCKIIMDIGKILLPEGS